MVSRSGKACLFLVDIENFSVTLINSTNLYPQQDMQVDAYEASLLVVTKDKAIISRDFRDRAQSGAGSPITVFNL